MSGKRYSDEFKAEAAKQVIDQARSVQEVSARLPPRRAPSLLPRRGHRKHRRIEAEYPSEGSRQVRRVREPGLLGGLRPGRAGDARARRCLHARPQQVAAKGDAHLGHKEVAEPLA